MDSKLDDSGYGSPGNLPAKFPDKLHFLIKIKLDKNSAHTLVEVPAHSNDVLANVIKQNYPQMKVRDHLFWAKIRGHAENKSVSPFRVPCGLIQEGTEVEYETHKGKIYHDDREMQQLDSQLSKSSCKLFYISMCDRKKKPGITFVHYEKLGRNIDVCVVARNGETFREALSRDGRFKNVEHFRLKRKVAGAEAVVGLDNIAEEVVFQVTVKGTVQPIDTKPNRIPNSPNSCPSGIASTSDGATQQATETPRKKPRKIDYNQLGKTLWRKSVVYEFPEDVDDLKADEMLAEMEKCLRALAWYTLLGPKDRERNLEKSLEGLAKIQFANHRIIARPASFTKKISMLLDSIGFLECGDIYATCFLVSRRMIVTSCHVVNMIQKARVSSTHVDYSEVFVYFNYEENRGKKPLSNGYRLLPLDYIGNVKSNELDYSFLFLEKLVEVEPLGKYVTCEVPMQGNVCIAGHPFGNVKQDEMCPILPLHDDGRYQELRKLVRDEEELCRSDPSRCTLSPILRGTRCVHMYCEKIEKLCVDPNALSYHVGALFEGSSGSPVFNMKCNIVALHTAGFRVRETSIMEYGVTFEAIIDNLKKQNRVNFVREHFPSCNDEHMQVD